MPRRLALLIANAEYQYAQLKRLRTPTVDAERLAEVLKDPAIGDFEVSLLVNEPLREVRRAIAQHFQRKTRDDLLLLYYSGHGIKPDYGELFLAVHDTEKELLEATALDAGYVRGLIDRRNSQRNVAYSIAVTAALLGKEQRTWARAPAPWKHSAATATGA